MLAAKGKLVIGTIKTDFRGSSCIFSVPTGNLDSLLLSAQVQVLLLMDLKARVGFLIILAHTLPRNSC